MTATARIAALRAALESIDSLFFNLEEHEMSLAEFAHQADEAAQKALDADDTAASA